MTGHLIFVKAYFERAEEAGSRLVPRDTHRDTQ